MSKLSEDVREMTLREEIKILDIDDTTKQRLLSKLKEYDCQEEKYNACLVKHREEMYAKIRPLEETNLALTEACEGLSRAMLALRKIR